MGPGTTAPSGGGSAVHANSYAFMVAEPASLHTASATLRASRGHELLPVLVWEFTEPRPYGADIDEGNGSFDGDLQEKLTRCASEFHFHGLFFY